MADKGIEAAADTEALTLGRRLSRDAGWYSFASFGIMVAGFVQVAILTRILEPAAFGTLAILLVLSTLMTQGYNFILIQGVFISVFGAAGGDEGAEVDAAPDRDVGDRRRAFGTGLVGTVAIASVGTLGVALGAGPISEVIGTGVTPFMLVMAAIGGALGSVWRLVGNVPRLERRPRVYVTLQLVRPVAVVALVTPMALSWGVEGVVAGIALGNALACVLAMWVIRHSFTLAYEGRVARLLVRNGAPLIPFILTMTVISTGDVLILSRFVEEADLGIYRVATRISVVVSYFVSGVLMAWGPQVGTMLWSAAERRHGEGGVPQTIVNYFTFTTLWLLLFIAVAADQLVRIAPPSYADAAVLIPLLAVGAALQGGFIMVFRIAMVPRKRLLRIVFSLVAAGSFGLAAMVLMPAYGATGAALAVIASFAVGTFGFVVFATLSGVRLPVDPRRLLGGVAIAIALVAFERSIAGLSSLGGALSASAVVIGYPLLLVALGLIPKEHLDPLRSFLRTVRGTGRRSLREQIGGLDPGRAAAIDAAVAELHPGRRKAAPVVPVDRAEFVAALRDLEGSATATTREADERIGEYLLAVGPIGDRDDLARTLVREGSDPLELARLDELWSRVSHLAGHRRQMRTTPASPRSTVWLGQVAILLAFFLALIAAAAGR